MFGFLANFSRWGPGWRLVRLTHSCEDLMSEGCNVHAKQNETDRTQHWLRPEDLWRRLHLRRRARIVPFPRAARS